MAFDHSINFNLPNDCIPIMSFVQYETFDLESFIKVTRVILNPTLADLNCSPNLSQAIILRYQAVLCVLLFESVGSPHD